MAGPRRRPQEPAARLRAAVLALPRRPSLRVAAPSRRSLAVGLALVALAAGAYAAARETSAFAVDRIDVVGAPAPERAQVRSALASLRGTSLLALDGGALLRRVEALPTIVAASYDRAFPHTLRLRVVPEVPVAVLHRGTETWLVSARGRAISRVPPRTHAVLPRIWVPRATDVAPGALLAAADGGSVARALALARRFPARIATAVLQHGELVLRLRDGLELRLGAPADVRLKLAVARRALPRLPYGSAYLDVSLPGRPVAGPNPQVSGRG